MPRKKTVSPEIAPLHVWESPLIPDLEWLVAFTQLAHSFAEALTHDRGDAEVLRKTFTRATEALRVGGWSGWPPPLIIELSRITGGFEEYFREVALGIYDDDDFDGYFTSIIHSASEVAYSAREFVNEREKSKRAMGQETRRCAAISTKAQKRREKVLDRYLVLKADDPYGPEGPRIETLTREFGLSETTIYKYLREIPK